MYKRIFMHSLRLQQFKHLIDKKLLIFDLLKILQA